MSTEAYYYGTNACKVIDRQMHWILGKEYEYIHGDRIRSA